MGRPKADIDESEVARLAGEGASNREIAAIVGVDEGTLRNRFSALLTKKRAERRIMLRNAQTREALAGNATLLIWLGKNELEQSDRPTVDDDDLPEAEPLGDDPQGQAEDRHRAAGDVQP